MENRLLITRNINPTLKQQFAARLEQIEQMYIDWFKKRPAMYDQDKHDSLMYHIFSEQYGNTFSFIFWKYSELPETIRRECIKAFKEIFEDQAA
ncbi:hypothetical protein BEL04_14470 [Mucilaginibacter sp. PPCGB 2223]|uniref:hypothetical protein n=1 Tax=Mucilaginibacter sp. PPCGB 2223 TaxID=1886027 RepID=UPI0008268529|nr:hypothetical protein [Mucilaginibacter sp. PPCGB 2223]OCX52647.1 hypothetical protein BEL04_14470 [Mucilaginibacter sp. PPCGB 2223]